MSKILDNLKPAELDRVALAEAESQIATDRAGKARADEQCELDQEAERVARERAAAESRAFGAGPDRTAR